ncbi:prolyl oligopeptidase family serine peptidase [Salinactinospora qingdaonensis]|uniref:Prolyl oligopeptidase family serine peptidase n=1 Tax=Salinactinospora qingdaonensis TaxID=702744 RepID=A0ABP7FBN3_9ACTN
MPYGAWPSPIDAETVAADDGLPSWPTALAGQVWWAEPRPREGGRVALCRTRLDAPDHGSETVLPAPWNARSRVHEYSSRCYVLLPGSAGPAVVFSEFSDQRLYRYEPGGAAPLPLTPEPALPSGERYAEPIISPDGGEVWCVRESHIGPAPTDVVRAIVAVPLDGAAATDPDAIREIVTDRHFLACPRVSPTGGHLSWIGWDHPNMPWDATELRAGALTAEGRLEGTHTVAGGPDEAIVQAEWLDADTLCYISDPGGWWNLHRVRLSTGERGPLEPYLRTEECGGPLWQLGSTWCAALADGRIATIHGTATTSLGVLDPASGVMRDVDTGHTAWLPRLTPIGAGAWVVGLAAGPTIPGEVVAVDLDSGQWRSLSRPRDTTGEKVPFAAFLPRPQAEVFTGQNGVSVHANLYPPHHPEVTGPAETPPPYVIFVHGGPTGHSPMLYDLEIAYFTSRGIGVADVEYGGSTGYGRAYRERLRGNWGVVDVADCVTVARSLAETGRADPDRLAIRGGSAGGWTAAAALAFTDTFRCAAIRFPILDLVGWRTGETHDFESQYLESIVGPWPQQHRRYEERSPINHADRVSAPFVLLQGLDDPICPPAQCERFLERVAGREVAHAYLTFEGEQHGFRRAATMVTALHAELSLYAQVFGFDTDAPPVRLQH